MKNWTATYRHNQGDKMKRKEFRLPTKEPVGERLMSILPAPKPQPITRIESPFPVVPTYSAGEAVSHGNDRCVVLDAAQSITLEELLKTPLVATPPESPDPSGVAKLGTICLD